MIKFFPKIISNLPGWRTKRKIIVIESDDWGSIRMPSLKAFQNLESAGMNLSVGDSERYNRFDTLASAEDLGGLFEILSNFRDLNGKKPSFTAVSLVANPDFEKIKASNFQHYFYEPFTETLKKYRQENAFDLWREGINNKLFFPQFHGREHLNVPAWMRALERKDFFTTKAFEEEFWGFRNKQSCPVNFQAAFDLDKPEDLNWQAEIIKDGLGLFEKIHGYKARFFVPPNGPFNEALIDVVVKNGIQYLSTPKIHHEPLGNGGTKRKWHYLGQKNKKGCTYLTRNAFFEPSLKTKDWVDHCLADIQMAFKWHKPAIISTHRVNYIGVHDPTNRDHGLSELNKLLKAITIKWPDVEFMTSVELGNLISGKKNYADNH